MTRSSTRTARWPPGRSRSARSRAMCTPLAERGRPSPPRSRWATWRIISDTRQKPSKSDSRRRSGVTTLMLTRLRSTARSVPAGCSPRTRGIASGPASPIGRGRSAWRGASSGRIFIAGGEYGRSRRDRFVTTRCPTTMAPSGPTTTPSSRPGSPVTASRNRRSGFSRASSTPRCSWI